MISDPRDPSIELAKVIGEAIARAYLEGKLDGQKDAPEDGASEAERFDNAGGKSK